MIRFALLCLLALACQPPTAPEAPPSIPRPSFVLDDPNEPTTLDPIDPYGLCPREDEVPWTWSYTAPDGTVTRGWFCGPWPT